MPHYKYLHSQTFVKDGLWLILINLFCLILFVKFDFFEWILVLVDKYEYLELDEVIPLTATLTLSLLVFTYRRMVEIGNITQAFEEIAKLDPLTNTLNRRAGYTLLQRYNENAALHGKNYSLLQIDLDNFKRINDLYGPSVGDQVLVNLAKLIKQYTADNIEIIHWHSDNFILIIPSSISTPFELANKLRHVIAEQLFSSDTITCSVGLSAWQTGSTLTDVLQNVEDALLDAKAANKNTVKVA